MRATMRPFSGSQQSYRRLQISSFQPITEPSLFWPITNNTPSNIGQTAALFRAPLNTHTNNIAALFRLPTKLSSATDQFIPTSLFWTITNNTPSNTYIGQTAALFRAPLNNHTNNIAARFRLPTKLSVHSNQSQRPVCSDQSHTTHQTNHRSVCLDQ